MGWYEDLYARTSFFISMVKKLPSSVSDLIKELSQDILHSSLVFFEYLSVVAAKKN